MHIRFLLNGEPQQVETPATQTLLDWLRDHRRLTGTKEGCNEGDCGACTVMVTDPDGTARALNACILFLPQLDGRAVRTVEGISGPDGAHHPVQEAMIAHHGSQCGFCTPGFIVSMATAHRNRRTDHDDQLAGNLCRCTGYAPIIRASQAAEAAPVPAWMTEDVDLLTRLDSEAPSSFPKYRGGGAPAPGAAPPFIPTSADALAAWYAEHPDATLIAGATDVGLWVTKGLQTLEPVAFLNQCDDLIGIVDDGETIRIGAMTPMTEVGAFFADRHPEFAEMIRRYGSVQVRNAATIGGNIANGSPIGDSPPALIALGATLHLRHGDARRSLPLEDFFIDYGKQDRAPGEFVEAISLPVQPDTLAVYKLSKRFDQDISAVCGAFNIVIENDTVTTARIAFGGMAGTPKRAAGAEAALLGQPWSEATIETACAALEADFTPLSDMRASAAYRRRTAANMLRRVYHARAGAVTSTLEVSP